MLSCVIGWLNMLAMYPSICSNWCSPYIHIPAFCCAPMCSFVCLAKCGLDQFPCKKTSCPKDKLQLVATGWRIILNWFVLVLVQSNQFWKLRQLVFAWLHSNKAKNWTGLNFKTLIKLVIVLQEVTCKHVLMLSNKTSWKWVNMSKKWLIFTIWLWWSGVCSGPRSDAGQQCTGD